MKTIQFFVVLLLFCISIFSCNKDENHIPVNDEFSFTFLENRNLLFYDDHFIVNLTGISAESEMPSAYKDHFKNFLDTIPNQDTLINYSVDSLGYPCWPCGELEWNPVLNSMYAFFPIIPTDTIDIKGYASPQNSSQWLSW
jgi:hypothetical protein